MTTNATKPRHALRREKTGALSLPASTSAIEIGGRKYFVTPADDMGEWLEDLEDVIDSIEAMKDINKAIPWEDARNALGVKTPAKRTRGAQPKTGK